MNPLQHQAVTLLARMGKTLGGETFDAPAFRQECEEALQRQSSDQSSAPEQTSQALINVSARPRVLILQPDYVQVLDTDSLGLADIPRPVILHVGLHDEYFTRAKHRWRQQLAATQQACYMGSRRSRERAQGKFMRLAEEYKVWMDHERRWYDMAGLPLPKWGTKPA